MLSKFCPKAEDCWELGGIKQVWIEPKDGVIVGLFVVLKVAQAEKQWSRGIQQMKESWNYMHYSALDTKMEEWSLSVNLEHKEHMGTHIHYPKNSSSA